MTTRSRSQSLGGGPEAHPEVGDRENFSYKPQPSLWAPSQARTIRIPVRTVEMINQLGRFRRELRETLGSAPTPAELARHAGLTPDKVIELQDYAREPVSVDQAIGQDGDWQLGDFLEDPHAVAAVEEVSVILLHEQLGCVLATLPQREAEVVRLRFGLTDGQPHTLEQISQIYGVARERIRQIETKTMAKLRQLCQSHCLRDYLD